MAQPTSSMRISQLELLWGATHESIPITENCYELRRKEGAACIKCGQVQCRGDTCRAITDSGGLILNHGYTQVCDKPGRTQNWQRLEETATTAVCMIMTAGGAAAALRAFRWSGYRPTIPGFAHEAIPYGMMRGRIRGRR
jgi:hypothetical protein